MTNHVHAIVRHAAPAALAEFMKQWKRVSSYRLARLDSSGRGPGEARGEETESIWQARYYCFNVYSREKIEEKLNYMHQNPVRAGLVTAPCDWRWSSARYYELGEDVGVPISWIEA